MEWKTSTAAWLHSKGPFVASGLSGELAGPVAPVAGAGSAQECTGAVRGEMKIGCEGDHKNCVLFAPVRCPRVSK